MSLDRQFGMHELPGTEQPVPQPPKATVSAGFELQMRGDIGALWAKIADIEARLNAQLSNARPDPKPWEREGVSRRTCYRRREARAGAPAEIG